MTPSVEQHAIFDAVASMAGHNLVVRARAGSGKTTTALMSLNEAPEGGKLMVAFNKHIAEELRRRAPEGVDVRTLHSLGLATLRRHLGHIEVVPTKGFTIARRVVEDLPTPTGSEAQLCHRQLPWVLKQLAGLYKQTQPVSMTQAVRMVRDFNLYSPYYPQQQLAELAVKCLQLSVADPRHVDFDDMIYLPHKLDIGPAPYSLVIIDETQDLNRGQMWLVLMGAHRVLAIGDERQCQPPGTLVRIPDGRQVPIESLRDGDAVVAWDRHSKALVGRTKPMYRVHVSKREYSGPMVHLRAQGRETRCTPDHKWTVKTRRRTNLWAVYLMRRGSNFRVGWCQVFNSKGSFHVMQRTRLERADALWLLSLHDSKREASITESFISYKYQIPQVQFSQSVASPTAGLLDQSYLNEFWLRVGTQVEAARDCLRAYGRQLDRPFYTPPTSEERYKRSTVMEVAACNLFSEFMLVPVAVDDRVPEWHEFVLSVEPYTGSVYSLDVPKVGHYVADGIVTHNSIYRWRGADSKAIKRLIKGLDADVLPLPVTYRCAQSIVDYVKESISGLDDFRARPDAPEGSVTVVRSATPRPGDFVLSRWNSLLVPSALQTIQAGVPVHILGGDLGAELRTMVSQSGARTCKDLVSWSQRMENEEVARLYDEGRPDLILSARDRYHALSHFARGCTSLPGVYNAVHRLFVDAPKPSAVTYSTVHKAKGHERDRVWLLMRSFAETGEDKEEDNIHYVAATRAREELKLVYDDESD